MSATLRDLLNALALVAGKRSASEEDDVEVAESKLTHLPKVRVPCPTQGQLLNEPDRVLLSCYVIPQPPGRLIPPNLSLDRNLLVTENWM